MVARARERDAFVTTSHEGGQVFEANDWLRLDRFLVCGSDAGTFYATGRDLSVDNMRVVGRCLTADPVRTINRIADVSTKGLAPKNDYAVMALAIATTSRVEETRKLAWDKVSSVCRIGTHLFHLLSFRKAIVGKMTVSRMGRTAIADWYNGTEIGKLAYEVTKYVQRDGVGHRDVLKLYHPKPKDREHAALAFYVVDGEVKGDDAWNDAPWMSYLCAAESAKGVTDRNGLVALIRDQRLPRECVPTQWLDDPYVWAALAQDMPLTALTRNLNKLTAVGLFKDAAWVDHTVDLLTDKDALKAARLHPMTILLAARTYAKGHGDKGKLTWEPDKRIVQALDQAFYLAFKATEPTGKRLRLCCDTSRSMMTVTGCGLTAREIAVAMALVTAAIEPHCDLVGFSGHLSPLPIVDGMTIDRVSREVLSLDGNTTYCRLPIEDALRTKTEYDGFVMFTDNETADGRYGETTKTGSFHATLDRYRASVHPALFVCAATAANDIRLSDPTDPLSLDIAGWSADTPSVISSFIGKE